MTAFMDDVPAICADILIDTFYDVHQFGTAAKVKIYTRLDKRYRVDSVTGNRSSAGSRYVYWYEFYVRNSNGTYPAAPYRVHEFSQADYR